MSVRWHISAFLSLAMFFVTGTLLAQPPTETSLPGDKQPALSLTQAIILGVVEGATEYLPVSSTGHVVMAEHLMGMNDDVQKKDAVDSLAICIQFGAILAVMVLYFSRIRQILIGIMGRDKAGLKLFINLIVAFLPAAVVGLLSKKWITAHLFYPLPIAVAFLVGGILILQQSWGRKPSDDEMGKELTQMTWQNAFFVGVMQCMALWPGFSRSLATILGCRWAQLRMSASVEFSFLLGLITLSAATLLEGAKHGKEMIEHFGVGMPLVALVTAFVSAVVSVRFMVGALSRFGLTPFGYYRILLAIACFVYIYR